VWRAPDVHLIFDNYAAHKTPLIRRVHCSTRSLEAEIMHYIAVSNTHPEPFVWTQTADEIFASVERFCRRISDSGDSLVSSFFRFAFAQRARAARRPSRLRSAGENLVHPGDARRTV
jgi:hypothetical protein